MHLFLIVLLIASALCLALAAIVSYPSERPKPSGRYYPVLIALGLLAWILYVLIPKVASA